MNDHLTSATQAAPFKVGAIYRQRNGVLVRLVAFEGRVKSEYVSGDYTPIGQFMAEIISLKTGESRYSRDKFSLLPGELDEAGNPIASSVREKLDAIYRDHQRAMDRIWAKANEVLTAPKPTQTEPKRPPLTWNTKTLFDQFPGYEVKSGGEPSCSYKQEGPLSLHPDLSPSSHQMPASHCLAVGGGK